MPEFNPGGASDLNQAVKLRYEANADTNAFSDAEKAKLAGIAAGATANAADAALRDRASHTGSQPAATISDFAAAVAATPAVAANTAKAANASHTGDVTGDQALTIAPNVVTNAKLADMASARLKGRASAGTGDPEDLTAAQATALLDTFGATTRGLAPASGGGTANFLRADGAWVPPPGGGGAGDVAGPAAAADNALVRFDGATGKLVQAGALSLGDDGRLDFPLLESPATPAADHVGVFGRRIAGRMFPAFIGPSGLDSAVQPFLARNRTALWQANGNGTTTTVWGLPMAAAGTGQSRNVATTNFFSRMRRVAYTTGTTAGTVVGIRHSAAQVTTGNGAGLGGFMMVIRFGVETMTANGRSFVGAVSNTAAPANVNPASLLNCIGMARIDGQNTWHIVSGGSTAQPPIDLGANFPADSNGVDVYELALFAPPGEAGKVHWLVTRLNTSDVASGTLQGGAAVLPAATVLLAAVNAWISNNTNAAANVITFSSVYLETDN